MMMMMMMMMCGFQCEFWVLDRVPGLGSTVFLQKSRRSEGPLGYVGIASGFQGSNFRIVKGLLCKAWGTDTNSTVEERRGECQTLS